MIAKTTKTSEKDSVRDFFISNFMDAYRRGLRFETLEFIGFDDDSMCDDMDVDRFLAPFKTPLNSVKSA